MNIETTELHILILDDDKADSTYLANCIRAVAPLAKIDSAATCRKAKAHLRAHPCDAVFLEIPFDKEGDAAGVSLALDLRTEFPNLNIIFCTAHTEYKPQAMD
ncbi:MAG: response regulator, partial [Eubacterium sp.]|nr:response regulator [Eubacterium sp.]